MNTVLFLTLAVAILSFVSLGASARSRYRVSTKAPTSTSSTSTELSSPALVLLREDAEAEHLELGMAERLDEKRFQDAEKRRVNLYVLDKNLQEGLTEDDSEGITNGPCLYTHCSAGRVCELDEHGDAVCSCIRECPQLAASRRVCSNHNETWPSDCHVYQQRCLCLDGSELCRDVKYQHVHISHLGRCRKLHECTQADIAVYPRRMRDWLFTTMRDMAAQHELAPHYLAMKHEAQSNLTQRWTNAAIWKWCNSDAYDDDRFVSVHELFPNRAPVIALEHCLAVFLDECDEDDDHRITLAEWGNCLRLDESELEDHCHEFTNDPTAGYDM